VPIILTTAGTPVDLAALAQGRPSTDLAPFRSVQGLASAFGTLARVPRWAAQGRPFTVWQHTLLLSYATHRALFEGWHPPDVDLRDYQVARGSAAVDARAPLVDALVHDLHEAITGDITGPLLALLRVSGCTIVDAIQAAFDADVFPAYGLDPAAPYVPFRAWLDRAIRSVEHAWVFGHLPPAFAGDGLALAEALGLPNPRAICPVDPEAAARLPQALAEAIAASAEPGPGWRALLWGIHAAIPAA
jgi:hypothetical protein